MIAAAVAVGRHPSLWVTAVVQAWRLARQVADGRLLVAPDCGHELMSQRPGLLNEALESFYRSTASVARERAR